MNSFIIGFCVGFLGFCILFCVYMQGFVNGCREERKYWASRGRAPLPKEKR